MLREAAAVEEVALLAWTAVDGLSGTVSVGAGVTGGARIEVVAAAAVGHRLPLT